MAETNEKSTFAAVENIHVKTEQAREAAAEEHSLTAWQAIRSNKRVVGWCVFFAFSCIGWGFDAQVNGAMVGVPGFRKTFG
jgi:hypothetical protein